MKRPEIEDEKNKKSAVAFENQQFEDHYIWLQKHMPDGFFKEINPEQLTLITHYLMGFPLQDYFCQIQLKDRAFVLILDSPDADLKVLSKFHFYGIRNYQTFISIAPPPFKGIKKKLRVAMLFFTSYLEKQEGATCDLLISKNKRKELFESVKERNPNIDLEDFDALICGMDHRFLRNLTRERLILALLMFFKAREKDHCQYEVRYNKEWKETGGKTPSVQIVFAWRNTPKYQFIYQLAKMIFRHQLKMVHVTAAYVNPYEEESALIISLALHGVQGGAAWEEADMEDFLKELVTLKCFPGVDEIERTFVEPGLLTGNQGNLVRILLSFIHQTLVHADMNQYNLAHIEEGLCRHPELTMRIVKAFYLKFEPGRAEEESYRKERGEFLSLLERLDTGYETNDIRRKNILKAAIHFVDYSLKTNFFRKKKSSFSFRLDPKYLDLVPYERKRQFPELPYAIFFMQGMSFIGFHIRFKDLSRGGLRTVFPAHTEQIISDRNHVFSECYNLAYTQQKKNKDIPEGGAKGVIFLEPYELLFSEADLLGKELKRAGLEDVQVKKAVEKFKNQQKTQYLYQTQRTFIHSFMNLLNCHEDGTLKSKNIVDYWKRPEYIYLGPDENMKNEMIDWIANYSQGVSYKPGIAFISSKPVHGINHKRYGVTSFGVNVYMEAALNHLNIHFQTDPFTVKISGGPDGDVAGNQILNLHRFAPKTAKLIALTDVSGTVYDPEGLDLSEMVALFENEKPIAFYPPKKLHEGGFLLDLKAKKEESAYTTKTLRFSKKGGKIQKDWLSGSETNRLFHHHLHRVKTDVFIPAGGRPRTLHENNYTEFLDAEGNPSSKVIVEGANLYLTPRAREALEKRDVLIIKDSSANKGGVICSSMEVLTSLILTQEEFLQEKPKLMEEILALVREKSLSEGELLLKTSTQTGEPLTKLSDQISKKINTYTYELLNYLDKIVLPSHPDEPLVKALLSSCLPLLSSKYRERIIQNLPTLHKKAMIACHLASQVVYQRGLEWSPSIVDVLPLIASDPKVIYPSSLKAHNFDVLS